MVSAPKNGKTTTRSSHRYSIPGMSCDSSPHLRVKAIDWLWAGELTDSAQHTYTEHLLYALYWGCGANSVAWSRLILTTVQTIFLSPFCRQENWAERLTDLCQSHTDTKLWCSKWNSAPDKSLLAPQHTHTKQRGTGVEMYTKAALYS